MWERPESGRGDDGDTAGPNDFEIPMYVLSVEVPDGNAPAHEVDDGTTGVAPVHVARQGAGTWPNGERAVRLGNAEEILITLPSDPFAAMDAARSATVFDPQVPSLRVDVGSRRDGDFEVSWKAALRAPVRWRQVSLRLYASPSLNVTVLTIVPDKARKISSRWFVRRGLRAARQLGAQIDRELVQPASAAAIDR